MIGCTARAVDDALEPDENEMAEVEWVHRDDILDCIAEAAAEHDAEHDDSSELLA